MVRHPAYRFLMVVHHHKRMLEVPAPRDDVDYFAAHFPEQFVLLDSQAALDQGLFGSGTLAPEARDRVGDLLALARGDYLLDASREGPKLLGRHGSLTPEEMLVPLLAARLD